VGVFGGPTAKAASLNRGRMITARIPFRQRVAFGRVADKIGVETAIIVFVVIGANSMGARCQTRRILRAMVSCLSCLLLVPLPVPGLACWRRGAPPSRSRSATLRGPDPDRLDVEVLVQLLDAGLAAVTTHLVAAERDGRVHRPVTADPDRAGAQPFREPMRLADVLRSSGRRLIPPHWNSRCVNHPTQNRPRVAYRRRCQRRVGLERSKCKWRNMG
jgi:hypothetical protein